MTTSPLPLNFTPMDTQIFNQGLSVEAISVYIIITAVISEGGVPSLSSITHRWNAPPEGLEPALGELEALQIIERLPGPAPMGPGFMVNPASLWGIESSWPKPKPLPLNPRQPK